MQNREEENGVFRAVCRVARETGLEPATSGVTGRRSNQLSYSRVVRYRGTEGD